MRAPALESMLSPASVAVFGSEGRGSLGWRVLRNLRRGGFKGDIYVINPNRDKVYRPRIHLSIEDVGKPVDLAVIATPASTIPELLRQCGERGVRGAVVHSGGFARDGGEGQRLRDQVFQIARQYGIRLVGPNCLGVMHAKAKLNLTPGSSLAPPGDIALVSQSDALCAAVLDWAAARRVGFSKVVALGEALDVDFGDLLDHLSLDSDTRSILLYLDRVAAARRLVSGLRAAARVKPVVVLKPSLGPDGDGGPPPVSADAVFDAVAARAGAVRVATVEQLFAAAHILSNGQETSGTRLAVLSNGRGPGAIAAARAGELGLAPMRPSAETRERLQEALVGPVERWHPLDLGCDAGPARYRACLEAVLDDPQVDAALVVLAPQGLSEPTETARIVIEAAAGQHKPVLACWMGERQVAEAMELFAEHALPHFAAPTIAVESFSYLVTYRRHQELVLQVPGPVAAQRPPDAEGARMIIEGAIAEGRAMLSALEAKAVLKAFRIPAVPAVETHSPAEALVAAESLGFPVAMKLSCPDAGLPGDGRGVRLNIGNAAAVRSTYNELLAQAEVLRPEGPVCGILVEPMQDMDNPCELCLGIWRDPELGPVVWLGGGPQRDQVVALPPLNDFLIHGLLDRPAVTTLLAGGPGRPAASVSALQQVLLSVSELACELPEVLELEIAPLLLDEQRAAVIGARVKVVFVPPAMDRYAHMAIYPYPAHLAYVWQLADGTDVTVRPIRPEDAQLEQALVRALSPSSRHFRFMQALKDLTPGMLVRLTQIDYDREMALIAVVREDGQTAEVGVARYTMNRDGESCELAVVVADAWQHKGIGARLLASLMQVARGRGIKLMEGEVLADNAKMLALAKSLGFSARPSPTEPGLARISQVL